MITKYSKETLDNILNLIDSNQLVELKIWEVSDGYNVQYLSLNELSFNKAGAANAEILLNDFSTLNNIEKMQNFLKEFMNAYADDRVKSFSIYFSCYKTDKCKFSCTALFDNKPNAKVQEKDKGKDSLIEMLEKLDDNMVIPGMYMRNDGGKNRKYTKATMKQIKEIFRNLDIADE